MKQKNIALVIYSLHDGGAEKVAAELSLCFMRLQHQVSLIVFDSQHQVYAHGGRLIDLNLPSTPSGQPLVRRGLTLLRRAWRLRRLYQRESFDLTLAIMESAGFASTLACTQTIMVNHCNPDQNFSRVDWLLARLIFPRARHVITVSRQGQLMFYNKLRLKNLLCIHNPVDIHQIRQLSRVKPPQSMPEGGYIIAIGRLERVKRFDLLIEAYAQSVLQQRVRLIILGQGSQRAAINKQLTQLGLADQVLMPGQVENPFCYMKQALFTVLSSEHEGFPMVLIESLCLGKPVIATDCATGPSEIIAHEQNGLLVPVNNAALLAQAMDRLLDDKALYRRLAAKAADSVSHLDTRLIAKQWLALCR